MVMSPAGSEYKFKFIARVRQNEVDRQGLVLCSTILNYVDIGCTDYLRHLRFSFPKKWNFPFYYRSTDCKCTMKSPDFFDDELLVQGRITQVDLEKFIFECEVSQTAGYQVIAQTHSTYVAFNPKKWEPVEVPSFFIDLVKSYENL